MLKHVGRPTESNIIKLIGYNNCQIIPKNNKPSKYAYEDLVPQVTLGFTAPEIISSEGNTGPPKTNIKSDIWSLAAIVYYIGTKNFVFKV